MNSHLLTGKVRHRRYGPIDYRFTHDVFYLAIDLAELPELDRRLRLFSYNGRNAASLLDGDHFAGQPLAEAASAAVAGTGVTPARITIVAYPRVFGYVFNPVTFFLAHGADGALQSVVAEVHNTHGERHVYPLADEARSSNAWTSSAEKAFYVSPFIGPQASYRFSVEDPPGGLAIHISERVEGEPLLYAGVRLKRRPLTDANLAKALLRVPFVGAKTTALIHWHALRLWRAKVPFHAHEAAQ